MKILSILLNPTIDEVITVDNFKVGGTFKVVSRKIYPVGKAISYALGIRELDESYNDLKVIACIGSEELHIYYNFLTSQKIDFEFIEIQGETRSNKTINDPVKGTTTHIRQKGFDINSEELEKLIDKIKENLEEGDIINFSGSIAPNLSPYIYQRLIGICNKLKAISILDSSGEPFINGVQAKPRIIKPNLIELSQLLGNTNLSKINFSNVVEDCKNLVKKAKVLLNDELKIILITLGANGAICLTEKEALYGNVKVDKIIDTVGSGDAFLAGFTTNYIQQKEIIECFKLGVACGAANTLFPGPGLFQKEKVEELIKKVEIIDLS